MKREYIKWSIALFAVGLIFWSCKRDFEFGYPSPKINGVVGMWTASKVELVDAVALASGANNVKLDITDAYNLKLDQYTITFSAETEGPSIIPTAFMVEANGAYNFIGISRGTWKLDNMMYPTKILLQASDAFDDVMPPNASFRIVAPPKEGTELRIAFDRIVDNEVLCSYVYTFVKVPEN
ncbi:hypothetical protein FUAX_21980 [Fulvitalea axinellae]|uniref:DUF5004 domain-containing protein n=1 Tax=Fulvitalea axinellae TaxID=1182444 RepID=A0AAU9CL93_9BACT|nr:hypothetical protein FUAX_21980 [Fulvitalea axinellae]